MKLFLIDAYALIYRSYYAFMKNPRINSKGMNTSAILGFVNTLEEVLKKENPSHIAVAFDPKGPTFRHEAYDQYKAQRAKTPEDIHLSVPYIKEIVQAYCIPVLEVPRYEADDVIGTIACQAAEQCFEVYMMTPDKDYGQLVTDRVFIYRPQFGGSYEVLGVEDVLTRYSLSYPEQMVDLLGLMGDSSDNIPGCPGVGEMTAKKILADFGDIDTLLDNTDQLTGSLKTRVEKNAHQIRFSRFLATIRTDAPIKFDPDACLRKDPNREKLREIYTELEFRTFLNRLDGREEHKTSQQSSAQVPLPGLFASDPPEDSTQAILTDLSTTPHIYHVVDTEEQRADLALLLAQQNFFAFDTETDSGANPLLVRLVGISFAVKENEAWYVPIPADHTQAQHIVDLFAPVLQDTNIRKVGQNIKYDIVVLYKYGVKVGGELFDTMIAHYLLNPELRHGMDYMAETCLGYRTIPIEQLIGPKGKGQLSMRDVPLEKIAEYAAEDADVTLKLKNYFEPELKKEAGHEMLFRNIEMPLIPVLADMEAAGVTIDTEALKQSSVELSAVLTGLEEEIHQLAGVSFNINSPKQVGEVLFDRLQIEGNTRKTKSGTYSTSEEVLEKLRNRHPVVEKLLAYRGVKKLLGTYVDALPEMINPHTGKIHTSFNQSVTATGRLSSTQPNLQNIPVRDQLGREIRKAFTADNDRCLFLSADYSQIELRIMAHLSGDRNMTDAFLDNADIHAATAAKIYNVPIDQITPDMRRRAKTANFGIIYGISAFGLAERLSIPRGEAKELIDGYFSTYPGVQDYIRQCIETARRQGYVETLFQRRRYLPDINSQNTTVRGYAERNAINAPIQGSAADIIKIAMTRIHQQFETAGLESRMLLQVHDELVFNVPQAELETVRRIVLAEMEGVAALNVPLVAACGWGKNWLEAH